MMVPFVKIHWTGKERQYIEELTNLCGDGKFTHRCHQQLQQLTQCPKVLLTHSCTAALEMSALLIDIQPGDEVIMPSYTFVSTANAFVLRGAVPVFIDIRPDTLNMDEKLIEAAITPKTKAIVPVHYAGVACEMDTILAIAAKYNLYVIEDAAQGLLARYKGRILGTLGHLGAYSFHETKNIVSGEGGALLINAQQFAELAEIVREKGTDRSRFYRGEVDKYTWQHLGSSYLPSELIAAFLLAQLEHAELITQRRLAIWDYYHDAFAPLEADAIVKRPTVPSMCQPNGHIYYVLLPNPGLREKVIAHLKHRGICAVFHYVPLHLSPAGQKYGRTHGELPFTESIWQCLVRLPLYYDMDETTVATILNAFKEALWENTETQVGAFL